MALSFVGVFVCLYLCVYVSFFCFLFWQSLGLKIRLRDLNLNDLKTALLESLAMLGSVPYPNTDQPCMSFEISNLRSSGSNQSPSLPTPLRKEQPFHLQLTLYTQHLLLECSRTRKRSNASQLGLKQQEQGNSVLFQSSSLPTYVKRMFPKNKPNP